MKLRYIVSSNKKMTVYTSITLFIKHAKLYIQLSSDDLNDLTIRRA